MGTPRLADFSPAYFGMVMATGIVSVAAHMQGLAGIAHALFWLNIAAYALIRTLNLLRVMRYPRRFLADLRDHVRGPGFFTVVAATSVLASQFIVLDQNYAAPAVLGGIGVALAGTWWIPMVVALALWRLRVSPFSTQVRPALLGRGFSARHVRRRDSRTECRDVARLPRARAAGFSGSRVHRVPRRVHRRGRVDRARTLSVPQVNTVRA